jgi:hypothetical protein
MELVLMLPENKPPFIGICFGRLGDELINQDLIFDHRKRTYSIIIEAFERHMNLRLVCKEIVTVRFYNHVAYDPAQLKSWLYVIAADQNKYCMFAHLVGSKGNMRIATTTPGSLKFALRVKSCSLFTPESFGKEKALIMLRSGKDF